MGRGGVRRCSCIGSDGESAGEWERGGAGAWERGAWERFPPLPFPSSPNTRPPSDPLEPQAREGGRGTLVIVPLAVLLPRAWPRADDRVEAAAGLVVENEGVAVSSSSLVVENDPVALS